MVVGVCRGSNRVVMQPKLSGVDGGLFDFLAPNETQRLVDGNRLEVLELVREHVDAVRTAA